MEVRQEKSKTFSPGFDAPLRSDWEALSCEDLTGDPVGFCGILLRRSIPVLFTPRTTVDVS